MGKRGIRKRGREMGKEGEGERERKREREAKKEEQKSLVEFANYSFRGVALQVISLELS